MPFFRRLPQTISQIKLILPRWLTRKSAVTTEHCINSEFHWKLVLFVRRRIFFCSAEHIFEITSQIYVYIIIFLIYVYILYTMIHDRNSESILLILLVWTAITEKYWCWYNWCLMIFWIQANCWNIYDDMNKD